MRKETLMTARTVDAAIEAACEEIGCSREDCEFEIVDLPKKAFFGLKSIPAKVRVWIEVPDEKPALSRAADSRSSAEPKPQRQTKKPQQKKEHQVSRDVKKPASQQKAPLSQPAVKREARQQTSEPSSPPKVVNAQDLTAKETLAVKYVADILAAIGLDNDIETIREDGGFTIKVQGKGKGGALGVIIGHRGETLDAIQYLTGLAVNRADGDYLRITIDCGDYRTKRKETLIELANRVAKQVAETNVSRTLEPMNPFERRIIHSTVAEIEGVYSLSVGDEPARRVVITTPTAKRPSRPGGSGGRRHRDDRPPREGGDHSPRERSDRDGGGRPPRRDGGRGPGGGRGERGRTPRPPQIVPDVPKTTPEAGTEGQLYSKIDLE